MLFYRPDNDTILYSTRYLGLYNGTHIFTIGVDFSYFIHYLVDTAKFVIYRSSPIDIHFIQMPIWEE